MFWRVECEDGIVLMSKWSIKRYQNKIMSRDSVIKNNFDHIFNTINLVSLLIYIENNVCTWVTNGFSAHAWWRHQMETFSALLAISPHKGQWHGALMFSLICVWINNWVNNREAGDLRHYRAHYDVIVSERVILVFISRVAMQRRK